MPKPDWLKIKNEYATTNISYRKLAAKHNVSFNTLQDRAKREDWQSLRTEQHDNITTKTRQKTAERISDQQADFTVDMAGLNTLAAQRARKWLQDENLKPGELKSVTGALKDISDIESATQNKIGRHQKSEVDKLSQSLIELAEEMDNAP